MSTPGQTWPTVTLPPRERLAALPTPLMAAPRLATALQVRSLYVKRDDLTGFAVAGNKTRPLEFLVADARGQRADVLLTGGSAGSNFCAAAATAARWAGLRCDLMIAGSPDGGTHPNLELARASGARLHWTGDSDRASVDTAIPRLADELRGNGLRVYPLPRGGATALGAIGYAIAAWELDEQLAGLGIQAHHLIVAVGSGGTLAGLLAGAAALGGRLRITGASVSRPVVEAAGRVLTLARQCASLLGLPMVSSSEVHLIDARGPGHGRPSEAGQRASELALQTAGLVLDPVYTAKALATVPAAAADPDRAVIFWHTGGLADAIAGLPGGAGGPR